MTPRPAILRRVALCAALLVALAGCADDGSSGGGTGGTSGSTGSGAASPAAVGAERAFVLEGFRFGWHDHPHRLNQFGMVLEGMAPAGPRGLDGTARFGFVGGSWTTGQAATDRADRAVSWAAVATDAARFHHDATSPISLRGELPPGPRRPGKGDETVTLDLGAIGLAGAPEVAVLIRGLELDTSGSHADGYTLMGLGAEIRDVRRYAGPSGADLLDFRAILRLEAGRVPDRIQNLATYGATGTLHYTVVAVDGGSVTEGTHAYSTHHGPGVDPRRPHAPPSVQRTSVVAGVGHDAAFAGLTGFRIDLNDGVRLYPGRYMRAVEMSLEDVRYDAPSGTTTLRVDGHFSNRGLVSYALHTDVEGRFVVVGLDDPGARVERGTRSGTQNAGTDRESLSVTF